MTSNIRTIALATLVAIASLSQTLHAQNAPPSARVNVPFSFDYGTKHFAHGVYTLTMDGTDVLRISSGTENAMAVIQTAWVPTRLKSSAVVFTKYGDRYFLDEVLIADLGADITVNESKAEKSAARELAQRGSQPTTLALAFLPEHTLGN
ncbi:MAG: hypothetical protein WA476_00040 [Acidobacteriaceae bacterium]